MDKPGVSPSKNYAYTTLGIEGMINGGTADRQVIDINVGDQLKIDGKSVFDGAPHRALFPIAPMPGSERHWKWIDSTIENVGGTPVVTIHRISPKSERPTQDSDWDPWPSTHSRFALKVYKEPHHTEAGHFWPAFDSGEENKRIRNDFWHNSYYTMQINEKVRD